VLNVHIIGDIHTVSCFRLTGIKGHVCGRSEIRDVINRIASEKDTVIITVTSDLAEQIPELIHEINLRSSGPVVIQIPGIDDEGGFRISAFDFITEAFGITLRM